MSMVDSSKIVVAQIKTSNLTSCEKIVSLSDRLLLTSIGGEKKSVISSN